MPQRRYNNYESRIRTRDPNFMMTDFKKLMKKEKATTVNVFWKTINEGSINTANYEADYFLNGVVIRQRGEEFMDSSMSKIKTELLSYVGTPLSPILKLIRREWHESF